MGLTSHSHEPTARRDKIEFSRMFCPWLLDGHVRGARRQERSSEEIVYQHLGQPRDAVRESSAFASFSARRRDTALPSERRMKKTSIVRRHVSSVGGDSAGSSGELAGSPQGFRFLATRRDHRTH